ncbi:MAG: hypothetical protein DMG87_18620 [Acidobacteria bacterium]|nr:MAG: hypothetical protein DMG87_18620 [Acidobacteriota bacterium]
MGRNSPRRYLSDVSKISQPLLNDAPFGFIHLSGVVTAELAECEDQEFLEAAESRPEAPLGGLTKLFG